MQIGLPVLANVNAGNDLSGLITDERVGQVCESNRVEDLVELAERVLRQVDEDLEMSGGCVCVRKDSLVFTNFTNLTIHSK
jgi:hypothetical protein